MGGGTAPVGPDLPPTRADPPRRGLIRPGAGRGYHQGWPGPHQGQIGPHQGRVGPAPGRPVLSRGPARPAGAPGRPCRRGPGRCGHVASRADRCRRREPCADACRGARRHAAARAAVCRRLRHGSPCASAAGRHVPTRRHAAARGDAVSAQSRPRGSPGGRTVAPVRGGPRCSGAVLDGPGRSRAFQDRVQGGPRRSGASDAGRPRGCGPRARTRPTLPQAISATTSAVTPRSFPSSIRSQRVMPRDSRKGRS